MHREYALYNFDHGFEKEKSVKIGKYQISVSHEQAANLKRLEQNAKRTFVTGDDLSRKVDKVAQQHGDVAETASLRVPEEEITPSVIYQELPERTCVDDVVLFLSFITGRRVFLEHDIKQEISTKYLDGVVNKNFFHFPSVALEDGFQLIDKLKLSPQFYNLVQVKTIRDLPAMCFYANTVVNALYERWCKNNGKSTYPAPGIRINEVKQKISQKLERSFIDKVKLWVSGILSEQSCDTDTLSDVVARINISDQPSALYKLQSFLVGLNLFPADPSRAVLNRLKWINRVRNMMVHMGDIPSDKKMSFVQRAQITTSITFILIAIAEYYYCHEIFNLKNHLIEQNANDIRKYFETGIFRGQKVFDETYEQFTARQEMEWIENGNYL